MDPNANIQQQQQQIQHHQQQQHLMRMAQQQNIIQSQRTNVSLVSATAAASTTIPITQPTTQPTASLSKYFKTNLTSRRKRPTDKTLSNKLIAIIPEAKIYENMRELEKRLDATITRKGLDIQDQLGNPTRFTPRTLRVYLSNTASNQGPSTEETSMLKILISAPNNPDTTPSWTFKIEGELLPPTEGQKAIAKPSKFSSYFKRIVVEVDRDPRMYVGNLIEWNKPAAGHTEVDGFEIKRRGDQPLALKIKLYLDTNPEKRKLSPQLASLLDVKVDTLPNVIMALWQYAKKNRLQDLEDRRVVVCDARLMAIFQAPKIAIPNFPALLSRHLILCDPITLTYNVIIDKEKTKAQAFDFTVNVLDPVREKLLSAAHVSPQIAQELTVLDDKICALVQSLQTSKMKRDFMMGFSEDPVTFIKLWTDSQSRDLEAIMGDTRINLAESGDAFVEDEKFQESLFHYLRSKDFK